MWHAGEEAPSSEDIVTGVISMCWRVEDGRDGCVTTEGVWIVGLAEKVM